METFSSIKSYYFLNKEFTSRLNTYEQFITGNKVVVAKLVKECRSISDKKLQFYTNAYSPFIRFKRIEDTNISVRFNGKEFYLGIIFWSGDQSLAFNTKAPVTYNSSEKSHEIADKLISESIQRSKDISTWLVN